MTILLRLLLLTYAAVMLSGCTTVYKQQNNCLTIDWFSAGFNASKSGLEINSDWPNLSYSCLDNNMWVDQLSYNKGYDLGLEYFCTDVNGFEFGQRALEYDAICTNQRQVQFDEAYRDGFDLYTVSNDISIFESGLEHHYETMAYSQLRIDEITYILNNNTLDNKTRKKYFSERRSLRYDRDNADEQIDNLNANIREGQRRLAQLEFTLFKQYYQTSNVAGTNGFSLDESVFSERIVVTQAAIIVYKPTQLSSKIKSQFNDATKQINLLITQKMQSNFRYQMVGDTDIEFVDTNQRSTIIDRNIKRNQPILFLWDGQNDLTTISYQDKTTEELLTSVEQFINRF